MANAISHYSILRHTDPIIDHFFGVLNTSKRPRYATRSTYLNKQLEKMSGDAAAMLLALHEQIVWNWRDRKYSKHASNENWRCEAFTHYNERRSGLEVVLEREIVKAMGSPPWYKDVPTSSGLCSPRHDKARNIDLVRVDGPTAYTFYELKWDANTPLFAAVEIIFRGILNVLCRLNGEQMGFASEHSPTLRVQTLHLRVLASWGYYRHRGRFVDLGWLENKLNDGLRSYSLHFSTAAVKLDFGFEAFPADFMPPFTPEAIRGALLNRAPAYARMK